MEAFNFVVLFNCSFTYDLCIMKSVEGKSWSKTSNGGDQNVEPAIIEILKTATLLSPPVGLNYYVNLLLGKDAVEWIKPQHLQLETVGALSNMGRVELSRIFHFMVDEELMQTEGMKYTTFEITPYGREFLEQPHAVYLHRSYLRCSAKEAFFYPRLKAFRKHLADASRKEEYKIFTNYMMDRIVMAAPATLERLRVLPGMTPFKLDFFGEQLIGLLQEADLEFQLVQRRRAEYWNSKPDHQYVKRMLTSNKPLGEIQRALGYPTYRVMGIFRDLHEAEEVDLRPWIESQVNKKLLFKGSEFFRRTQNTNVDVAAQTLGMDLPTLYLCQLYVYAQQPQPETVKVAS